MSDAKHISGPWRFVEREVMEDGSVYPQHIVGGNVALAHSDAVQAPQGVVLPDGSGFFTASLPLPKDHWLYAPRCAEWDAARDTTTDTPHPILTHAQREAVVAAVRYAIRGATMCGKESDFDPDALVQNAVYALCGPYGFDLPSDTVAPAAAPSDWQPIETAPKGAKGYSWMNLAWGPEGDQSTGIGMRWGDRFFAVGTFYCLGQEKQYEFREIEVNPTHWMPLPAAPSLATDERK